MNLRIAPHDARARRREHIHAGAADVVECVAAAAAASARGGGRGWAPVGIRACESPGATP
jgi:hypothetical protein